MKHFYLIANPSKESTAEVGEQIMQYLRKQGAACEICSQKQKREGSGYRFTDEEAIPLETECVITLGGDGTLIQAARDLEQRKLPLIGINMGNLGYLTQVAKGEDVIPMLDALLQDNYRLEKRMMLNGEITGGEMRHSIALNDIVLTRKSVMQMLKFNVYVNGELLNEYSADGMVVATPTGSTAYNLSAGGPIVSPQAELIVMTPICAHSVYAKSIVLSAQDHIQIRMVKREGQRQTAVFDGDKVMDLSGEQTLNIRKSERYTTLIQLRGGSFLDNLRNRMASV
ncbi:MAG: NAD(+)/NADH kinase [Lachnospiraceae bacterium]